MSRIRRSEKESIEARDRRILEFPRRMSPKEVAKALRAEGLYSQRTEWLVLHIRPIWFALRARAEFVLISSAPNGWADVFASKDGCYDRYGYNVVEDRWAYDIQPPDSSSVEATRSV